MQFVLSSATGHAIPIWAVCPILRLRCLRLVAVALRLGFTSDPAFYLRFLLSVSGPDVLCSSCMQFVLFSATDHAISIWAVCPTSKVALFASCRVSFAAGIRRPACELHSFLLLFASVSVARLDKRMDLTPFSFAELA